jgi:NAD(P)-dependent dehydrogenase (short-subunit alcohol dehydrogenase family)
MVVIGSKRGPLESMAAQGFVVVQGVEKSVHAVMAKIDSRFGRLDVRVHCAGEV